MFENATGTVKELKTFFNDIFNRSDKILASSFAFIHSSPAIDSINTSDIASELIIAAGRWCENYASDVLIDWDRVRDAIKHCDETSDPYSVTMVFGFRRSGVDHDAYVFSNMKKYDTGLNIDHYYAKIYAVNVSMSITEDGCKRLDVVLKDIKQTCESAVYEMKNRAFILNQQKNLSVSD